MIYIHVNLLDIITISRKQQHNTYMLISWVNNLIPLISSFQYSWLEKQ